VVIIIQSRNYLYCTMWGR